MRLNKLTWFVALGAASLGVLGVAAAQTVAGSASVDIQAPREVNLSSEQQLSLANAYVAQLEQSANTIRTMLEQARASHDVVKTLCLNDKLNQLDVANRSVRDRMTSLQSAAASKDQDRARHEFMIVQVLHDRSDQLVKEANQCIGEEMGFIGESQVTVDIDKNIPNPNPDYGLDPDFINQPPEVSSPTL